MMVSFGLKWTLTKPDTITYLAIISGTHHRACYSYVLGMWHSLLTGGLDEEIDEVFKDVIAWIKVR